MSFAGQEPPSSNEPPERKKGNWQFTPSALARLYADLHDPTNATDIADYPSFGQATRLGRFEVEQHLGYGGFGVVYLAFDPMLKRRVALKVPRYEILHSPDHRERFLREGRSLAKLDHPGIVPVYETGEDRNVIYIATGYCPGPNLATYLHQRPEPLSPHHAAAWMISIAEAVHHAHQHGVLHCDLKPSNILLEPLSDEGPNEDAFAPRVTDFGLSKEISDDEPITAHDGLIGTPPYLAPEQALRRPQDISVQTDVYMLGAILYEMLCGRPPFDSDSGLDLLRQVVEEPPLAVRTLRPSVPKDLANICMTCLEKSPASRYRSALELAEDLGRFLENEPVRARPIGRFLRTARWCRRRPVVASLLAGLFLTIAVAAAAVLWQWNRAERYGHAVEQGLVQAEQGLVNMSWVLQEMNYWSETTDPFQAGGREKLLRHYERMLARPAPSRPSKEYLATMESFRARVGELSDQPDIAGKHFEKTIQLWGELVRAHPESEQYRQALVVNLASYGAHLHRCGIVDHPLSEPWETTVLINYLLELEPSQGLIVVEFAEFLMDRGKTLVRLDQARQAHAIFRHARGLAYHGYHHFPNDLRFQRLFAKSLFYHACSHRRVGRRDDAIQCFAECNQWLDLIMAKDRPTQEDLLIRADSCRLQAACMRDAGETEKAITMFETARYFLLRVEDEIGESPRTWNLMASTTDNLAELYEKVGKHPHSRLNRERFCDCVDHAFRQHSANEGFAIQLPSALFELAQEDLAEGRRDQAQARLERACEIFEFAEPRRDMHADRRIRWAACLALLADMAMESGNLAKAVEYHRTALKVLEPAIEVFGDDSLKAQAAMHETAIAGLQGQLESSSH